MKKLTALLVLLFAITANAQSVPELRAPDYAKYGVTRLRVNEIQIVNQYTPPFSAPNVEHEFYLPPYAAIRDWAQKRYQAVGNMGVAKVEIIDASVIKKDLPVKDDFVSFFTDQVDAEYRMHVKVRIEIISPNYNNLPYSEVELNQTIQTKQGITIAKRDAELHAMVINMLDELDRVMAKTMAEKLANIIQ